MSAEWPTPSVCYYNAILAIFSIITTIIAIVAYFQSITIRQAYQNILLLNLLMNSLVFLLTILIYDGKMVILGNTNFLSVEWICSMNGFLNLFCCGMEIYTLMCIALERFFAIKKQSPLTLNQIIGLLVFGYIWGGFTSSLPLLNSSFNYSISSSKTYCGYTFHEQSQLLPSILSIIHGTICIAIINFCYFEVYQCYRLAGQKSNSTQHHQNSMLQSIALNAQNKKNEENEFRVFLTTIILVGWTMMGWTPMLVMIMYQIITGNSANHTWDAVSAAFLLASISGDSFILLVYDRRWKASVQEMIFRMRKIKERYQ